MRLPLCLATFLLAASGVLANPVRSNDHPADGVYDVGSYLVRFRADESWQVIVNAPREFIHLRYADGRSLETPDRVTEFNTSRRLDRLLSPRA